jgi:hypothetical protein
VLQNSKNIYATTLTNSEYKIPPNNESTQTKANKEKNKQQSHPNDRVGGT